VQGCTIRQGCRPMTNTQQSIVSATLIVVGFAALLDAPTLAGNTAGGFAAFVGFLAAYNVFTHAGK
jgi:hypothetical protein